LSGPSVAALNRCVIEKGAMMAVKLTMPAMAPCSSPWAFAGTCRERMARIDGIVRPTKQASGTLANSRAGVVASP